MPQREQVPSSWSKAASSPTQGSSIALQSQTRHGLANFSFETIRPGLFRTRFWSQNHPLPPYPNCKEPTAVSTASFKPATGNVSTLNIDDIEATVDYSGAPVVSLRFTDRETALHSDLPDRSYVLDGEGAAHYMRHDRKALHVGLGEKAAPMDLTARPFILSATDCFGYEAYRTDPMYKHVPLLIKATPEGVVGVFSTSHARGFWSVGSEIDGLWGHFKVYRQEHGGLEEYLLMGRTLRDVVRLYAEVVGYPLMPPRWCKSQSIGVCCALS
jgi:alpha-glucosidase (family GH31 glycosyl hydrolase)